jgi:hypothetical protein
MSEANKKLNVLWNILRLTFSAVPIIAGLDKFINILVHWDKYLNPGIISILPFAPHTFMLIAGIIEIAAGIIVFTYTKIGSYIVMIWLISISLVLISGGWFDIAVRDLVLAITAYVLTQLTELKTQIAK